MYLSTLTPESEVRGMRFPFEGLGEGLFCIFFSKLDSHQNKAGIAKSRPQALIILWYLHWLYNQPANRGCYWLLAFEISGNGMKNMVYMIWCLRFEQNPEDLHDMMYMFRRSTWYDEMKRKNTLDPWPSFPLLLAAFVWTWYEDSNFLRVSVFILISLARQLVAIERNIDGITR